MANVTYTSPSDVAQMTVGVATTSGAINTTSTNIVSNESPLVLPATTTLYYLAAGPAGDLINLNGFSTHTPGAGTFYYTIWMSSSPDPYTYTNMTAILTVLKIQN
jgi:hypothetical protein